MLLTMFRMAKNMHFLIPKKCTEVFSIKFETVLIGYSGARGKLIHEKNLKLKISYQTDLGPLCNLFALYQSLKEKKNILFNLEISIFILHPLTLQALL
jgi:hypothetical protein